MKDAISLQQLISQNKQCEELNFLWRTHVVAGYPHLLSGREGCGKTSIALKIVKDILECDKSAKCLWLALEGSTRDLLQKATEMNIPPDRFFLGKGSDGSFSMNLAKADLSVLRRLCRDIKPTIVVVDSVRAISPFELKSDKVGLVMTKVNSIVCDGAGAAVIYLHHLNKNKESTGKDKVLGSVTILASVRLGYLLGEQSSYVRKMQAIKDNVGLEPATIEFWKIGNDIIVRKEPVETAEKETKSAIAERLILSLLYNQESVPAEKIYEECGKHEISRSLARTVKSKLGLKDFFKNGRSWWQLPIILDTFDTTPKDEQNQQLEGVKKVSKRCHCQTVKGVRADIGVAVINGVKNAGKNPDDQRLEPIYTCHEDEDEDKATPNADKKYKKRSLVI